MKHVRAFSGKDNLVDLIEENYNLLPVLSRFNVPLGFQNKRIDEVCRESEKVLFELSSFSKFSQNSLIDSKISTDNACIGSIYLPSLVGYI